MEFTQLEPSDQTESVCLLWKPISRYKEMSMIGWCVIQYPQQNGWTTGHWFYCLITIIQVLSKKSIEETRFQKRKWRHLVLLLFVIITRTWEEKICGTKSTFLMRLTEEARSDFTFEYSSIFWTLALLIRNCVWQNPINRCNVIYGFSIQSSQLNDWNL